jgi:hypothetical protein
MSIADRDCSRRLVRRSIEVVDIGSALKEKEDAMATSISAELLLSLAREEATARYEGWV